MKVSTNSPDKNFAKKEVDNYLVMTNFFGTLEAGDFVEWDVSNIRKPILTALSTHKKGNYSFARAFPNIITGTAFGKIYDCYGYQSGKVKADPSKGDRGTKWEKAPWCDLNVVTDLVGYPAPINALPETIVTTKNRFEGTWNGNVLIDLYANHRGKGDVNYDIWPPFSKLLNTQIQCNFARKRMPDAHAYGWSGGHVILEIEVAGVKWRVAHKLEKLAGNLFDFLSWCAWDGNQYVPVTEVNCSAIWNWTLENFESIIVPAALKQGIKFQPRLTMENLRASYCDGVHLGSELLGECDGKVIWEDFEIRVDKENVASRAPVKEVSKKVAKKPSPAPTRPGKGSGGQSKKKPQNAPSGRGSDGGAEGSVKLKVGQSIPLPGTEVKQGSPGRVESLGDCGKTNSVCRHLGDWNHETKSPAVMLQGAKPGKTRIKYVNAKGESVEVWVEVS